MLMYISLDYKINIYVYIYIYIGCYMRKNKYMSKIQLEITVFGFKYLML